MSSEGVPPPPTVSGLSNGLRNPEANRPPTPSTMTDSVLGWAIRNGGNLPPDCNLPLDSEGVVRGALAILGHGTPPALYPSDSSLRRSAHLGGDPTGFTKGDRIYTPSPRQILNHMDQVVADRYQEARHGPPPNKSAIEHVPDVATLLVAGRHIQHPTPPRNRLARMVLAPIRRATAGVREAIPLSEEDLELQRRLKAMLVHFDGDYGYRNVGAGDGPEENYVLLAYAAEIAIDPRRGNDPRLALEVTREFVDAYLRAPTHGSGDCPPHIKGFYKDIAKRQEEITKAALSRAYQLVAESGFNGKFSQRQTDAITNEAIAREMPRQMVLAAADYQRQQQEARRGARTVQREEASAAVRKHERRVAHDKSQAELAVDYAKAIMFPPEVHERSIRGLLASRSQQGGFEKELATRLATATMALDDLALAGNVRAEDALGELWPSVAAAIAESFAPVDGRNKDIYQGRVSPGLAAFIVRMRDMWPEHGLTPEQWRRLPRVFRQYPLPEVLIGQIHNAYNNLTRAAFINLRLQPKVKGRAGDLKEYDNDHPSRYNDPTVRAVVEAFIFDLTQMGDEAIRREIRAGQHQTGYYITREHLNRLNAARERRMRRLQEVVRRTGANDALQFKPLCIHLEAIERYFKRQREAQKIEQREKIWRAVEGVRVLRIGEFIKGIRELD